MIRVLIADDHHLVRQGIRALLERQPGIQVVGEAQDGQETLEIVAQLRPDVLILDINMPKLNGIEAARRITESRELISTEIVILSMYSDESLVKRAFRCGVRGYLLKKSITEDLIAAVQAASRHEIYLSPALDMVIDPRMLEQQDFDRAETAFDRLSAREVQVCQLVAQGLTNNAIALTLGISVKTVEKHRANLMVKLGVQDIASLIREALRHGVVFLDE
jgi:DNA-binding NarL/FixJ family response regulator